MQEQRQSQAQAVIRMHDCGIGPILTIIPRVVRATRVLGDIELAEVLVEEICNVQDTSDLQQRLGWGTMRGRSLANGAVAASRLQQRRAGVNQLCGIASTSAISLMCPWRLWKDP